MPSSVTHSYFMRDVYNKLDDKIKDNIILEDAKTFAQGPDIFYFYNMCFGKKSNKYRNMGNYMHKHNVNLYFNNMINYINNNNLKNDKQCISFLYGSICHFVLDSVVHPFVFYKTGVFNKNDSKTYKYNGLHQEMEYYLDAYMIFQNEKTEAKDYMMYKYILNNNKLNDNTLNLIGNVIKDTYNYNNMDKIYEKCIKDMKNFFKYFNYDHYGIKKKCYSLLDIITPKKFIRKKKFSFYLKHNSKKHYLNLDKNEWNHPISLYETYNYSFIELYVIAIDRACTIIKEVDKILESDRINNKKIERIFNNLSYTTGKDCDDDRKMKYFEF